MHTITGSGSPVNNLLDSVTMHVHGQPPVPKLVDETKKPRIPPRLAHYLVELSVCGEVVRVMKHYVLVKYGYTDDEVSLPKSQSVLTTYGTSTLRRPQPGDHVSTVIVPRWYAERHPQLKGWLLFDLLYDMSIARYQVSRILPPDITLPPWEFDWWRAGDDNR